MKSFIYSLTLPELQEWMQQNGEKAFRAGQVFDWLYVKRVGSFAEMTNLSKALREKLDASFSMDALREITRQVSQDGTVKFLFSLHDGHAIETVIMRHNYGNSICVTTQVGCRIGCTFCASTLGGLKRNLEAGEIVAQVLTAQKALDPEGQRASHVVVMGIGEPFENYDALLSFLRIINDKKGLNIGQRHITVSTSGIVPYIYRFADEKMQVNLAISLHAPNAEIRTRLMPVNRRYPMDELMRACEYYIKTTGRRLTFEYGLFGGVNDQPGHAEELAELLDGMLCHVNLIPVNYVPERNYVRTARNDIFKFLRILQAKGINATIRREHGSDIAAACGQLRAQHAKQT
ncbi:23S rRNA (adenine(2503)-C(2))-methyltransferase RlmN [Aneurinibacillus thermoaerophilus]|jgi:23S rRNA (adenine2503-C2)-methyltransferase|uniref:Probable dual-specificity RNA methyltransferase RlmN n=1 Tax=Aneurinibacillus thermoaerophilus TaxID=143495 RepID=A0A1G7WAX2_ANETH|nr:MULTISPECIES: 23S rRNA (adenine(2503)-C(2))-methyltransferase RlmN [Aneurinibacillus]AMA72611.1 23S rRNA (adenine(2503)-C2)-methyltransferase [Aneurinibacillus sp. XH2]MED0674677.1 23S rRNA (adenine(2503)-C(2))-methyltransferase RlmN [Aneurinibacillus thermoaerophilus]MED0680160.1 23S rRNA (adenine(2503)-C(2))-methyltransferase RlmN [Aneurinibacillus thermoaerophilus]MED0756732.1 23S rRNA (adenine(2503)-C(2))-methyltransferase RlmN [Aneurinibacillus thermoaerophilus]MED0760782.1 23S rRNA (a